MAYGRPTHPVTGIAAHIVAFFRMLSIDIPVAERLKLSLGPLSDQI